MPPLDEALRLAAKGLAVFPLEPRDKRPHTTLARHGYHDASADLDVVTAWWTADPEAGVGLPCAPNQAAVVDVDAKGGGVEAFKEFRNGRKLPRTWCAETGGGGRHYCFKLPPGDLRGKLCDPVTGETFDSIDIKVNGYIAVQGTTHPNGKPYRWLPGYAPWECELADAPDWLLAGMVRPEREAAKPYEPPAPSTNVHADRLTDEEIARRALAEMNPARADDYQNWIEVGQACHSIGDHLFDDWAAWSAQSPKFTATACRQKWDSFHRDGGRTLGTLVEYARQDGSNLLQPGSRAAERELARPRLRDTDEMGQALPADDAPRQNGQPQNPTCLGDWGHYVDDLLSNVKQREMRATRQDLAESLVEWALSTGRLIWDPAARGAYLLDQGRVVLVTPKPGMALRATMMRLGVNPSEDTFKWLVHAFEGAAFDRGKHVVIARWVTYRQTADAVSVYVTCGDKHLVRATATADGVTIEKLPNGTDDVWFAEDAWFPEWPPTDPVDPLTMQVFRCPLDAGGPVNYDEWTQRRLLRLWLVVMVSGVRPLWMLALLGGKGSGKSTVCRGIAKLLDPASDVTATPDDVRDFETSISTQAVCPIDNIDATADSLPKWFPDRLATTVTGGQVRRRALYTNGDTYLANITACVALSSRTAAYTRPDLTERTMPVMTREIEDPERIAEAKLWAELDANRSAVLTWMVSRAAQVLRLRHEAPGALPSRFVDAAQLLWADLRLDGLDERTGDCLRAMGRAQAVMVQGGNPLLDAILEETCHGDVLRGTPKDIVEELEHAGHNLPQYGGWKRVGGELRELKGILQNLGYRFAVSEQGNASIFTIEPPAEVDDDPFKA